MTQIVNNNRLTFVLTKYGRERLAEALADVSVEILLSKIKLGDANGEYYNPTDPDLTNVPDLDLKSPISGAEFYLVDKSLMADGLTVCLHAVIPEVSGGYDIREVGLYETINGEDKMFAISTQQPFVKPTMDDGYFIAVDYYMYLKSQDFASVYGQIIINPDTGLVTYTDLDQYLKTVLFSQASLMDQIGHNSQIIGLDRAGQLSLKVREDRDMFGYLSLYDSYTSFLNEVDVDKVFGFWVFNYPRRTSLISEITDISENKQNMVCNKSISTYERQYSGVLPELNFTGENFYAIPPEVNVSFLNYDNTSDAPFSMLFCVSPRTYGRNETRVNRTLLAKSDESLNVKVFEVQETSDDRVKVTLYATNDIYATFTSEENVVPSNAHSLLLSYNEVDVTMKAYINGIKVELTEEVPEDYTHMNADSASTIYGWTANPVETIYSNTQSPTSISNLKKYDGSPADTSYWSISDGKVYYQTTEATYDNVTITTEPLYAYSSNNANFIYIKDTEISGSTQLYNSDYTVYVGSAFEVVEVGGTYVIQYGGSTTSHISASDIAAITLYQYSCNLESATIWANSSSNPGVLLNEDGTPYTGDDWSIDGTLVLYKGKYTAAYDSDKNKTIRDISVTSYLVSSAGTRVEPVDSYVSVISIIKEELAEDVLRRMSLLFSSAQGVNPCLGSYEE